MRGDDAVSNVVGALVVLAVVSGALVYVNAVHVPRQGAALEVAGREDAERALADLASRLASGDALTAELPLKPPRAPPPLLSGVVLTPARSEGRLALDPDAPSLRVSAVVPAPAGGVPAGDPTRVDLGDGRMRVYLVGNATAPLAVGGLVLSVGGGYLEPAEYRLEAGAVLVDRDDGSDVVSLPGLLVRRGGSASSPTTAVSWTIPRLAGPPAEVGGAGFAQVGLAPGPVASAGGGSRVHNLTIEVTTTALAGWTAALSEALGGSGAVAAVAAGEDSGTVTAVVLPPAGAAGDAVEIDLALVGHEVSFGARAGG